MYVLFDTETTALISNTLMSEKYQPEIIEFYSCKIDEDYNDLGELEFLCKPRRPLTDEITRITGITNNDLEYAKPFSHYADEVAKWFSDGDAVVAHNLSYDKDVLKTEYWRLHQPEKLKLPRHEICTVEATEWFKGYRLSLSALHEHLFNEPFSGAHRAKADVQALKRCFIQLLKNGDV